MHRAEKERARLTVAPNQGTSASRFPSLLKTTSSTLSLGPAVLARNRRTFLLGVRTLSVLDESCRWRRWLQVIPVWLFACTSSEGRPTETSASVGAAPVSATELGDPVQVLPSALQYRSIAVTDGWIAVLAIASDTVALVYPRDSSGHAQAVKRSDFPGPPLRNGWSVVRSGETEGVVEIFDVRTATMRRLVQAGARLIAGVDVSLRSDAALFNVAPVGGGAYAATGLLQRGRVAMFDDHGRYLKTLGLPPPAPDSIPVIAVQHAYQGKIVASSDRGRMALSAIRSGRIVILDTAGQFVADAQSPDPFPVLFEWRTVNGRPLATYGSGGRVGYVDLTATDDLIAGLYSGYAPPARPTYPSGGEVHVFDWEGKRVARIVSQRDSIRAIALDPASRSVFALTATSVPRIIRFPISPTAGAAWSLPNR